MERHILPFANIHPGAHATIANSHRDFVEEAQAAIAGHEVVVLGMKQNPVPRKVRALLDGLGIPYHYIEHGSYLSGWRRRNALKMWTGWPTFPMVFVKGVFVGGFRETKYLADSGELARILGR